MIWLILFPLCFTILESCRSGYERFETERNGRGNLPDALSRILEEKFEQMENEGKINEKPYVSPFNGKRPARLRLARDGQSDVNLQRNRIVNPYRIKPGPINPSDQTERQSKC